MISVKKLKEKHKKKINRFKKYTTINLKKLDEELSMNASRLYSAGMNKADAEFIMDKAKAIWKNEKSKSTMKWSKKRIDGKKLTIPQVTAKVESDTKVLACEMTYLDAKYVFNLCEAAVYGVKEKGQQLANISFNKRAEMNSRSFIKDKETRVKNKTRR